MTTGTLLLIRGGKLELTDVDPRLVGDAMRPGRRLVARIQLTGAETESALTWSAEVSAEAVADPGRRQQIGVDVAVLGPGVPGEPRRVLSLYC